MSTYCIMCKETIPDARAIRGSYTCSKICHDEYRKQRRAERSKRQCRFCGNRIKHKQPAQGSKPQTTNTGDLHTVQHISEELAGVEL
jgi:hypothetical protein